MTIATRFLDQFTAAGQEKPVLALRRRSFFRGGYDIVATWRDGTQMKLARFDHKDCAQYWLEVEGPRWLHTCGLPISLGRALRL
jgi:hypothetical protein